MVGELSRSKTDLIRVVLSRTGEETTVERPDGTATENKYGKIDDEDVTYNTVTESLVAYRHYESFEQRPSEDVTAMGRIDTETPRVVVEKDHPAQEDDKLSFPDGKEYIVDELVPFSTHDEIRVTLYNAQ